MILIKYKVLFNFRITIFLNEIKNQNKAGEQIGWYQHW